MILTHHGFVPTPDGTDKNDQTKRQEKRADDFNRHFADMVAYMDKLVGKLLAQLGELGLLENTLVLLRQWSDSEAVQFGTRPSR